MSTHSTSYEPEARNHRPTTESNSACWMKLRATGSHEYVLPNIEVKELSRTNRTTRRMAQDEVSAMTCEQKVIEFLLKEVEQCSKVDPFFDDTKKNKTHARRGRNIYPCQGTMDSQRLVQDHCVG